MPQIQAFVFDIGMVLHEWSPYNLYRKLLPSDEAIEKFLTDIAHDEWNRRLDTGLDWAEEVERKAGQHPEYAPLIRAYHERWEEMAAEAIEGSVAIMSALKEKEYPVYALTNYSQCKLDIAREKYPFLKEFDGMVVSSDEGVLKPDPQIYKILLERYNLAPENTFFTDDREDNVTGARALGIQAFLFTSPEQLRADIESLDIPL